MNDLSIFTLYIVLYIIIITFWLMIKNKSTIEVSKPFNIRSLEIA